MNADSYSFRSASVGDLDAIADIHKKAYSKSHFTSLLPIAVLKRFYNHFLGDDVEILLLTEKATTDPNEGEIIGFAVYGRRIAERIALFKHTERFAILKVAARHPLLSALKAVNALLSRYRQPTVSPARAILLSIAVARTGMGAGRLLLREMHERVATSGERRVGLYVNVHNIRALNSYFANGYRVRALIGQQYYMEAETGAIVRCSSAG